VRVSSIPTVHGEKIVMRLLNFCQERPALSALGLEAEDEALLRKAISRPHGMVLSPGLQALARRSRSTAALNSLTERTKTLLASRTLVRFIYRGRTKSTFTSALG